MNEAVQNQYDCTVSSDGFVRQSGAGVMFLEAFIKKRMFV